MSTLDLVEQLARDVGWGGGLLYLVDLAGGAISRYRAANESTRRMIAFERSLLAAHPQGAPVRRPLDGGPVPSAAAPPQDPPFTSAEPFPAEAQTSGRGRPPR